ncbi:MAG: anaerobic ribonucleoside-triphosphate reductase activating protein, partial [Clostridiales bacterium]|nr:anaerobic ribonucleoside-triphosphate reductase activating protein [Clostridiales bacterium]
PRRYPQTVGIEGFDVSAVMRSADIIMKNGVDYEFRTTVVKGLHEARDFEEIGEWLRGAEKMFLQSFVDSGDLIDACGLSAFGKNELEKFAETLENTIKTVVLRGV